MDSSQVVSLRPALGDDRDLDGRRIILPPARQGSGEDEGAPRVLAENTQNNWPVLEGDDEPRSEDQGPENTARKLARRGCCAHDPVTIR